MGERDYAVIINDIFYCRTEDSQTAMKIVESIRSRPAPSPQNDYRDLFVSDLIAIIKWDAEHGNPELFKAVNSLKQHYKSFTVEAHDATIRNATLDELETFVRTDHSLNRQIGKRIMIAKIQSLRSTPEAQK